MEHTIEETEKAYKASPPLALRESRSVVEGDAQVAYMEPGFWTRLGCTPDSFKRCNATDGHNKLKQTLKPRHLHMIAIGGSIGAGLFVGSGAALHTAGPASLIIDFAIIGVMIFNVVYALGELAVMYPISGGFYTYSTRFIDPSWGFAMGWNYVMSWTVIVPFELTVASLTVQFWPGAKIVSMGVWITIFLVGIIILNVFGAIGYGEEEFWAGALKLIAIVIFIFIAIVLVCGGGPAGGDFSHHVGARLWSDPGAFNNGFKGFCAVFVTAAVAYSGTELVGLAAAEAKNPRKALPGAIKQVFWRITIFYIISLLMVGLLVPYNSPRLLGGGGGVSSSPFVIAADLAGLHGFDSFINIVILVSVMSIGNSGVYGGSRTLTALAEQGYAPKCFAYVDRAGRPLVSVGAIILFGCLGYVNLAAAGDTIFVWLQALSGLSVLFTWGSICLAHIRFRAAWKHNGHTLDEIPFRAIFGVWGSWCGLALVILVLIAQLYTALFPIDKELSASSFFQAYLALPVILVFWACGYLWRRQGWWRIDQIDIDSGRRELDWEVIEKEQQEVRHASLARRLLHLFC